MKTKLPTYFVSQDFDEYIVIKDAWDDIAGNYYETVKSGFATEEEAAAHADQLNR